MQAMQADPLAEHVSAICNAAWWVRWYCRPPLDDLREPAPPGEQQRKAPNQHRNEVEREPDHQDDGLIAHRASLRRRRKSSDPLAIATTRPVTASASIQPRATGSP